MMKINFDETLHKIKYQQNLFQANQKTAQLLQQEAEMRLLIAKLKLATLTK
jgi:hypothetical protein